MSLYWGRSIQQTPGGSRLSVAFVDGMMIEGDANEESLLMALEQHFNKCKFGAAIIIMFIIDLMPVAAQKTEELPSLNFAQCKPVTGGFSGALGSTTYQIVGKSRHGCVMLYG